MGSEFPQTPCCPGVAISEPDEKETEAPVPSLCVQTGDSTAPGPWGFPPMDTPWLGLLFLASLLTTCSLPTAAQATPDASLLLTAQANPDASPLVTAQAPVDASQLNAASKLLVKPTLIANQTTVIENKGTLTLHCNTNVITIRWFFQSLPLVLGTHMHLSTNGKILTFITTKRGDSGTYQCEVQDGSQSQQSNSLLVNVNYGPDPFTIKMDPGNTIGQVVEVLEGSWVTFSVNTQSYPTPTYTWIVPYNPVQPPTTSTFTISSMSREYNGSYKCVVANSVTQITQLDTLEVRVLELLTKPSVTPPSGDLVEGSSVVTLTCHTNHLGVSIRWLLKFEPLQPSTRLVLSADNRTLSIHRLRRTDTGPYQCLVWHNISEALSSTVYLTIYYGPDHVNISSSSSSSSNVTSGRVIKAALGSSLTLFCKADAVPRPQYHWSFKNLTRQGSVSEELLFKALTWEHEGQYICRAQNPQTFQSRSNFIQLKVVDPSPALSAGAIAGIVLGVLAAVVLPLLFYYCYRKSRRRREQQSQRTVNRESSAESNVDANSKPGSTYTPKPRIQTPQIQRKIPGNPYLMTPQGPTARGNVESDYERRLPGNHNLKAPQGPTTGGNMESDYTKRRPAGSSGNDNIRAPKGHTAVESDYERRLPGNHNLRAPQGPTAGGIMESDYEIMETSNST